MAVWLVTGGSGFIGRHVLDVLSGGSGSSRAPETRQSLASHDQEPWEVYALGRTCPPGWPSDRFVTADLENRDQLIDAIQAIQPDRVIHARRPDAPGESGGAQPREHAGTFQLLDVLKCTRSTARLILTGSAAELGPVDRTSLPVNEDYPCHPPDPYGNGKWMATRAAISLACWVDVVIARVFNPIGPGQPRTQALGAFASELAAGRVGTLGG